jgi:hypothetical protein
MARQIGLICSPQRISGKGSMAAHNGGSARGYQDLVLPLTDLNGRRPDRMFMRQ